MQLTNPPHSLSLNHQHLVLAVTAASHPPPEITLSPRYVNSLTVSTSSHNLLSCSTASPMFPSNFLHVKFLENFGVTLFNMTHLPWMDLPHCTHNTELAFTLKLQTPHGSTLLLDKPSFVIPLLTITLVFSQVNFQTFALKSLLPF